MQFLKYFNGRNNWTRGIIKLLRVLQVISLYAYCTVNLASADDIEPLVLSKCDYLNHHISQSNAFWRNGKVGHICCMCPVGTKYTGTCNSTDPTSTVCGPCDDGTFQDYQPHIQKECESQILRNCYDPHILERGSITTASKCVCKGGTEEIGILKKCTPISGRSPIITTDSTILTKITQNLSSAKTNATTMPSTINKTNIPTSATSTTTVESVADIKSTSAESLSDSTVKTYTDHIKKNAQDYTNALSVSTVKTYRPTDHIKKDAQDYTRLPSWVIVLIVIGLLLLILIIYVCRRYYKTGSTRSESDVESVKYDGPSSSTDLSSRSQLMNGNESPQPGCIGIMTRRTSSSVQAPNGAGPPIIRNGVQREGASATPFINSVQTDQENQRLLVNDVNQNQEVSLHYNLPAGKLDEFVRNLAVQWVTPTSNYTGIGSKDIRRVFRELFKTNHDYTIEEIFGAYPNDTKEIVYKLMKAVQRHLGRDLTPQYIIEKLEKKHPQLRNLIDITVDLLEKYRVAATVVEQC